jgi:hypothetical protein
MKKVPCAAAELRRYAQRRFVEGNSSDRRLVASCHVTLLDGDSPIQAQGTWTVLQRGVIGRDSKQARDTAATHSRTTERGRRAARYGAAGLGIASAERQAGGGVGVHGVGKAGRIMTPTECIALGA